MIIDKTKITGTRFMFALTFYLQSSALLTSFLAGITKHESWIPVVIGCVICIPLIYLYRTLMVMFPDKNFLQMLEEIFGKFFGKILGFGMLWFFLNLTSLNMLDLDDFMKITFLPETPHFVLMLCCLLLSTWAVRYGFGVVSRYSSLFTIIEFVIVGVSVIFLLNQIDFTNFLPLFSQPAIKYVQSTHIVTVIPIGEIVVFLMVTPCVNKLSRREATKYWFVGAGMGVSVLLIVLLRDISILGNALHIFTLPGLVTLRLVNFGEALSRIEVIFAIGAMMLLFFKITVLVYVSTIALSQFFGTTQYKNVALIVSVFVLVYAPTLYPNGTEHTESGRAFEPMTATIFEILIPLLAFIAAKIRKLPKAEEGSPKPVESLPLRAED